MAEKNARAATKKPAAGKKRTSSASQGKTKVQNTPKKPQASQAMTAEAIRQRNQIRAVILFACAILLACLVLIEGDNLWNWTHRLVLGIFGNWALLWPVLMIYVAVVTTLEKPKGSIGGKVWMTVLIIVLFCTTGFVFTGNSIPKGLGFWNYIAYLYQQSPGVSGGVIGGLLGLPLLRAAGEVGAKIIILLMLFVSIMILTGTTLIGLFRTIKKPVDVVSEGLQNARQRREEERLILERDRANIDVPIDALPAHPVHVEPSQLFPAPTAEKKKKKPENNEKLNRLQEVFGFGPNDPKPAAEPEPQKQPENTIAVGAQALEEAVKEISDIKIPAPGRTVTPRPPVSAPAFEEPEPLVEEAKLVPEEKITEEVPQTPLEMEAKTALEEVQEVTDRFVKEIERERKPEASLEQKSAYLGAMASEQQTYCFPPVTMLAQSPRVNPALETEELQTNGHILVDTLKSFGVQTKILDICRGPSVTRYEIQPAAGVKISKITNLADDLALNLAATGVRIEAPIPGKAAVGIEVPNKTRNTVRMRDLIEANDFQISKGKLTAALGRDIAGQVVVADLAKMPHLLIAGTTGSGKSVCINSLIISMLYKATPDEVRFLMIDPKAVELTEYNGMPHMLVPVVTDPHKASGALGWAVSEMMKRYKIFAEYNVRNLSGYNSLAASMEYQDENGQPMPAMPQIVIIIDELADLMMASPKEVEDSICRLAQLARAAGMHLVVATQRPSVDVVTGLIKANIPSRIALTVSTSVDSRTILDTGGAEKLLGNGDMLFAPVGAQKPVRVQGCYVSDEEISSVVEFVKKSKAIEYDAKVIEEIERNAANEVGKGNDSPEDEDGSSDPMIEEAVKCVVEAGQASTSLLQRRLRLGYARAGRLIDEMEQMGIVGPHEGSKPRQVLMTYAQWLEKNMQRADSPGEE